MQKNNSHQIIKNDQDEPDIRHNRNVIVESMIS